MIRPDGGDDPVRRIKDSLDIVDLIGSYIELKPRGANYLALCPFHAEKTPSFSVNRHGQFFHCFGCKKSGDVFEFIMAMEGVTFPEALKLLADRCGIELEQARYRSKPGEKSRKIMLFNALEAAAKRFEQNLKGPMGQAARNYLLRREMHPEVTSRFRIGFATEGWNDLGDALLREKFPESDLLSAGLVKRSDRGGGTYDLFRNRLMIPIFDLQGRVVGFGGRVLDDALPKYINSPETPIFHKSRIFYGLNLARRALSVDRYAVVVEGYTDVIMAHSRGATHAIATLGTALTDDHAKQLRRMVDRVILLFDGDEAGNIAAGRGVEVLLSNDLDVTVVTLAEGVDPFEYFSHHSAEEFQAMVQAQGEDFFDFSVRFHGRQFDLTTAGGKARLARELLKLVHCHKDLIKKNLLIKKIAGTLGIDEDVLRREYKTTSAVKSRPGQGSNVVERPVRTGVTITSSEDDLILGLLGRPSLVETYREALELFDSEDGEAGLIIKVILDLDRLDLMNVREITCALQESPDAMKRVIALASDPRKTDPELLVKSAVEVMKKKRFRKEYKTIRDQSRAMLQQKGTAESDRILEELNRRLKDQGGSSKEDEHG